MYNFVTPAGEMKGKPLSWISQVQESFCQQYEFFHCRFPGEEWNIYAN